MGRGKKSSKSLGRPNALGLPSTKRLTPRQHEVALGILLGDAWLERQDGGVNYRLGVSQGMIHSEYAWHLLGIFRGWTTQQEPKVGNRRSRGKTTLSVGFRTINHPAFTELAALFYPSGKKVVPNDVSSWLTPRALTYWFMDDGSMKSKQSKGVIFNTQAYSEADVEKLIAALQLMGLDSVLRPQGDGPQIYVSGHSYERLVELTNPYLYSYMRYKMPPPRRTSMPKM